MTANVSLDFFVFLILDVVLLFFSIRMLIKTRDSLSDIESYSLEHSIWWGRIIPTFISLFVFIVLTLCLIIETKFKISF